MQPVTRVMKIHIQHVEIDFIISSAGCDPSIKNKRGETPLDYVPQLQEYYQVLYCNWIKELPYLDDMSLTIAKASRRYVPSLPPFPKDLFPFPDENDYK
jgi:hypothetical protein